MVITNNDHSVAFIGHRSLTNQSERDIFDRLTVIISELYDAGYRTFICGTAIGFDLLSAEACLMLKVHKADLRLVVVAHDGLSDQYSVEDQARYKQIVDRSDERRSIPVDCKSTDCRNCCDYLVDNCSTLVTYFDGKSQGATAYAVARANDRALKVINLY